MKPPKLTKKEGAKSLTKKEGAKSLTKEYEYKLYNLRHK